MKNKEYIICTDKIESLKLLDDGRGTFKLKTEKLDHKAESKNKSEPINLDIWKLRDFQKVLNEIIPKPKYDPLVISKDDIKMIVDSEGTISLGELARYLKFDDVQSMVNLLPDSIRITKIGNNPSQAVLRVSELTKAISTSDLKTLKTPQLEK